VLAGEFLLLRCIAFGIHALTLAMLCKSSTAQSERDSRQSPLQTGLIYFTHVPQGSIPPEMITRRKQMIDEGGRHSFEVSVHPHGILARSHTL